MIAEKMGGNDTVVGGTLPQRMSSCLSSLDTFLSLSHPVVSSFVMAQRSEDKKDGGPKVNIVESVARILGKSN